MDLTVMFLLGIIDIKLIKTTFGGCEVVQYTSISPSHHITCLWTLELI